MSARTIAQLAALALVAPATLHCTAGDTTPDRILHEDTVAMDHADTAAADEVSASIPVTLEPPREPGVLHTVDAVPVQGRTGPNDQPFQVARRTREHHGAYGRQFGTRTLMIGLRTRAPDLTQYPCTSCHLGRALVPATDRAADAHQDITATHPAEADGCTTCHAGADVELLELRSGERVTIDHVYRLCAQCHFSQADDWAAGAHGKRLDGWQGRRVVMSCTECHDPHQPVLQQRVPFRAPILDPDRSRQP
jgi:hypothetical protein